MQESPSSPVIPFRRADFDLVAALATYEAAGARLVESWFDMHAYADFTRQIDAIHEHAVGVPALTVVALQLFIAHCELVSTMWQHSAVGLCAATIEDARRRHALAVTALRIAAARVPDAA